MDWLRKAPTTVVITVIITCGLLASVLVAAFVILELQGADTAPFRQWVNTIGQLLVFPLLGTAAVASVSAAKSANRADEQTNGTLTARDREIEALRSEQQRLLRELNGSRGTTEDDR